MQYTVTKVEKSKRNHFILCASSDDIEIISIFHRLINMPVKNVSKNNLLVLVDGISLYYSSIAYNRLHSIENSIRALLTEVMCFFGSSNWAEKEATEILNIEVKNVSDPNILYSRNFDQLEKFLFTAYSEYSDKELLETLLSSELNKGNILAELEKVREKMPATIWEKHFQEVSRSVNVNGDQLQKLLKSIYSSRNNIAHCNTFHKSDFEKFENDSFKKERAISEMINAIEQNRLVTTIETSEIEDSLISSYLDTIVVPAKKEGFEEVFIGKAQWYEIRISDKRLNDIRFIAAYQVAPTSAITHFAEVKEIVSAEDNIYKKKVIFKEPAQKLPKPIILEENSTLALQGPRYTSFEQLQEAETLTDLFG